MEYNLGTVRGTDGKGIESITKINTTDNIDTYQITYTNGDTQTYTVTNAGTVVDTVQNGNMNPVTSNAVYDYVNNIIGDIITDMNR